MKLNKRRDYMDDSPACIHVFYQDGSWKIIQNGDGELDVKDISEREAERIVEWYRLKPMSFKDRVIMRLMQWKVL